MGAILPTLRRAVREKSAREAARNEGGMTMGIRIDHPSGRVMVRGEKPQPVRESDQAWKNLESRVLAAAIVMRGGDVGAKINEVERMQSLAEDLYAALQREDEGDE